MNFLSLNINGVLATGKQRWVCDLKRDLKLDFVGIQETHQGGLKDDFVARLWDRSLFAFDSVDATGRSGGILSIWDPSRFRMEGSLKNRYFLLTCGKLIGQGLDINILNIYAPNDAALRRALWEEILGVVSDKAGLWVALGDFNDVRGAEERVNSAFNPVDTMCFNDFIRRAGWLEYNMMGGRFTYISDHLELKMSKLDRILVCSEFVSLWPSAMLKVSDRRYSDHCPISLSCVNRNFGAIPFKFFNSWLENAELVECIKSCLLCPPTDDKPDVGLRKILKAVKEALKAKRKETKLRDQWYNDFLKNWITDIEGMGASRGLSSDEKKLRVDLRRELHSLELSKIKDLQQKARFNWAKYGDENAKFFHGIINSNIARSKIDGLLIGGIWVTDPEALKAEVFGWFRSFFKEPIRRRSSFANLGLQTLTPNQAQFLCTPFEEAEIWNAIKDCSGGKSPGPDGFTLKFFKEFWVQLKSNFINLFNEFFVSGEISFGCNASFITLIPKKTDPQNLNDFRPISLVSSVYKILAKVLCKRLKVVLDDIIGPTQSAFVGGRSILDGPLMVSEIISWAKKEKYKLLVLKIDFHKAYDSLNWEFLFAVMNYMGFTDKWVGWMKACLSSGRGSVLLNGAPTAEFAYKRGLRQGDPISPFLFIIAMEAIKKFMDRAVELGLFKGVKLPNDGPTVSTLCFADDVIFLGEWSEDNVVTLTRFLRCVGLVSGLKVNNKKCHLYGFNVGADEVESFASILKCSQGALPFSYLGVPLGVNMKRIRWWQPVFDKFNRRLTAWKAKTLSFAGRLTLIKSVLSSIPSYLLSLFPAPKFVLKKLEGIRRDFLWGKSGTRSKIRWVKWDKLMVQKNRGGAGVGSIEHFNLAMLSKWWWRFKHETDRLWVRVVKSIHCSGRGTSLIPIRKAIAVTWKDIGGVDRLLRTKGTLVEEKLKPKLGNGAKIMFWKDCWVSTPSLKCLFPGLYSAAKFKNASVMECYSTVGGMVEWSWSWRNNGLPNNLLGQQQSLVNLLMSVNIGDGQDVWEWTNTSGELFSVKDLRAELAASVMTTSADSVIAWNHWAIPKANVFMWRLLQGRVPTKVELTARGIGMPNCLCPRCSIANEDTFHAFVSCIWCRSVWCNVLVWLRISWPGDASSVESWFGKLLLNPGSKRWKKTIGMVYQATVWRIWLARNRMIFDRCFEPVRETVDRIKEDSFLWFTSRSKRDLISWAEWSDFNITRIL